MRATKWINPLTMMLILVDMVLAGYLEIEANDSDSDSIEEIPRVLFTYIGLGMFSVSTFALGLSTLSRDPHNPDRPAPEIRPFVVLGRSVMILSTLLLLASVIWAFLDYDTISETASSLEKNLFISNYSILGFCAAWQAINQSATASKEWKASSLPYTSL